MRSPGTGTDANRGSAPSTGRWASSQTASSTTVRRCSVGTLLRMTPTTLPAPSSCFTPSAIAAAVSAIDDASSTSTMGALMSCATSAVLPGEMPPRPHRLVRHAVAVVQSAHPLDDGHVGVHDTVCERTPYPLLAQHPRVDVAAGPAAGVRQVRAVDEVGSHLERLHQAAAGAERRPPGPARSTSCPAPAPHARDHESRDEDLFQHALTPLTAAARPATVAATLAPPGRARKELVQPAAERAGSARAARRSRRRARTRSCPCQESSSSEKHASTIRPRGRCARQVGLVERDCLEDAGLAAEHHAQVLLIAAERRRAEHAHAAQRQQRLRVSLAAWLQPRQLLAQRRRRVRRTDIAIYGKNSLGRRAGHLLEHGRAHELAKLRESARHPG